MGEKKAGPDGQRARVPQEARLAAVNRVMPIKSGSVFCGDAPSRTASRAAEVKSFTVGCGHSTQLVSSGPESVLSFGCIIRYPTAHEPSTVYSYSRVSLRSNFDTNVAVATLSPQGQSHLFYSECFTLNPRRHSFLALSTRSNKKHKCTASTVREKDQGSRPCGSCASALLRRCVQQLLA